MKALVVDDSRAIRLILKRTLAGLGYDVVEAGDGKAALDALEKDGPFAVALVDWNMPVLSGIDLVRAVRADRSFDGMRIMMVTTESGPEQVATALAEGADEYLMKPFTADAVASKLELLRLRGAA